MQTLSRRRHAVVALLGAAGLVAGSGVAAAADMGTFALPGTDDSTSQIVLGSEDMATVEVNPAGASATEVSGTFTNKSDANLNCRTLGTAGLTPAVTVADAETVRMSMAYLSSNLLPPPPPMPGLNPGSVDVMLGSGSLGSLGLGNAAAVELDAIQQAQDEARVAGHYGLAAGFVVEPGDSADWAAELTVPNAGQRTNFDAGALVTCEQGGDWYAFAGYEEDGESGGGGSLSMGSLGS